MAEVDYTIVEDLVPKDGKFDKMEIEDITAALSGKTLLIAKLDSEKEGGFDTDTVTVVLNFSKASAGAALPYQGEVNGSLLLFNNTGTSRDGLYQCTLAVSTIKNTGTQSSTITRSGGEEGKEEEVTLTNLDYRDTVALGVLGSMIHNEHTPLGYDDTKIKLLVSKAFRVAIEFRNRSAEMRKADTAPSEEEEEGKETQIEVKSTELNSDSDKLLYNLIAELEKTNTSITEGDKEVTAERTSNPQLNALLSAYVAHTPQEGESADKTTVGLDDLIKAIKSLAKEGGEGGGGGSTTVDFTSLVEALNTTHTTAIRGDLPEVNLGKSGLGKDKDNPIYISGGGFPTRDALAAALEKADIHDFITFNAKGAVGYSTLEETRKAILDWLVDYASLSALATAVYAIIQDSIQASIDSRVKAWLNSTTIVADGAGWKLNVPDSPTT